MSSEPCGRVLDPVLNCEACTVRFQPDAPPRESVTTYGLTFVVTTFALPSSVTLGKSPAVS